MDKAKVRSLLEAAITLLQIDNAEMVEMLIAQAYAEVIGPGVIVDPGPGGGGEPTPSDGDPRALNCRSHQVDPGTGKVTGIHITIHKPAKIKYRCVECKMLDRDESGGNAIVKVIVVGKDGQQRITDIRMGTGYNGGPTDQAPRFDDMLRPGNPDGNFFMGREANFAPPNLGPLGFVVTEDGQQVSEAVCSWGLSRGQHIGGVVRFQEV